MDADPSDKSLYELYDQNPDEADRLLFGRQTNPDRRGFLRSAGLAAMGALVGASPSIATFLPTSFPWCLPLKPIFGAKTA